MLKLKLITPGLIMLSLLICSEYIMDWCPMEFRSYVNDLGIKVVITWGDVLYHLFIKVASGLSFVVLFVLSKNNTQRMINLALIIWFVKDIIDKLYYIAEYKTPWVLHNLFFSTSDNGIGFIFQVTICILVFIFGIIPHTKCTFFFRFLALFSWPFWSRSACTKKKLRRN